MSLPSPTATFHHDVYPAIDPNNPALSVAGKTVLITGAGQGIGAAFAQAFATAGAANIVLLGRRLTTLDVTKGAIEKRSSNTSKVYTFEADITNKTRIDAVFAEVASTIGKIDIYIGNAAYLPKPSKVAEADINDFETALSTNVIGTLITAQAFLKHKADTSTLISINSGAAHCYYLGIPAGYVSSKAASARLIDQLAAEHLDLRVFNLQPGAVKTAMADLAGFADVCNDTPELPAAFAVWLSSPEADFLRGRFVFSNWDVDELKQMDKDGEFERNEALFQFNLVGWPFRYRTHHPGVD